MALFKVIFFSCVVAMVSGSAIPMWEYLSKDEKMAYLYNMFTNQVEEFCNISEMDDCSKQLLKYGLKNLHDMPEDHLDTMDPYQRGANTLIWAKMMEGHAMMQKPSPKSSQTETTTSRDVYDDFSESNYLGSASSRKETVLNLSGTPILKSSPPAKTTTQHYGPMVVRLHPDGRPVQETEKILPSDDDVHHYNILKTRIPTLESLEATKENNLNRPYPYAVYARPNTRR